jgi:hypothetical protein
VSVPSDEQARALARRVAALPESTMRRVALAEALAEAPADEAVAMLAALVHAGRATPGHPYAATLAALAHALGDPALMPYELRRELYAAAKQQDREEIARLFFESAGGEPEPRPPEPERALEPRGRPLTLGERKSLARGPRGEIMARLLRDPDAAVIRVLLENPRLVEKDVIFVAARRPARPDVLRAVFESRWIAQYHVKRTLVLNPGTPGDIAVRLLPTLAEADLRAVAHDAAVAEATRTEARLLLAARP